MGWGGVGCWGAVSRSERRGHLACTYACLPAVTSLQAAPLPAATIRSRQPPRHSLHPAPDPRPPPGADVSKLEAAAAAGGKAAATKGVPRSDCVLLVKNLPYSSSEEELEALFGAMGALGCVAVVYLAWLARAAWVAGSCGPAAQHVPGVWAGCGLRTTSCCLQHGVRPRLRPPPGPAS